MSARTVRGVGLLEAYVAPKRNGNPPLSTINRHTPANSAGGRASSVKWKPRIPVCATICVPCVLRLSRATERRNGRYSRARCRRKRISCDSTRALPSFCSICRRSIKLLHGVGKLCQRYVMGAVEVAEVGRWQLAERYVTVDIEPFCERAVITSVYGAYQVVMRASPSFRSHNRLQRSCPSSKVIKSTKSEYSSVREASQLGVDISASHHAYGSVVLFCRRVGEHERRCECRGTVR